MVVHEELLKIARAQDPKVYENFFQTMQYSIIRKVLGETLTSFGNEGGTGSKAQGDTHADTLDQRSVELCRSLQSVINDQLVRPLVMWNFGPNAPMPRWQFDLEEAEDLELALTIDSGLQRMGKQFTAGYVSDRYDRPLAGKETEDQVLVPNVTAPAVALRDTTTSTFAEREAEAAMRSEMEQYDKLFGAMQKDARGIFRQRVRQIAATAVPPREQ